MISATVIPEPELEFGCAGRQLEQRRGLMLHGPADVGMEGRKNELRLGIVGPTAYVDELAEWLKAACKGVERKQSRFEDLFPAFPGCSPSLGFLTAMKLPAGGQRRLTKQRLRPIQDASSDIDRIARAVEICAEEVRNLHARESVDIVMVIRPDGVPPGVPEGAATGADFHDLLKADLISTREPIQLIRTATWRGGKGVEDQATCAWNLFTALYYKAGGKPWRLVRSHSLPTRCYVGVSFTQSDAGDELLTSVAQVPWGLSGRREPPPVILRSRHVEWERGRGRDDPPFLGACQNKIRFWISLVARCASIIAKNCGSQKGRGGMRKPPSVGCMM